MANWLELVTTDASGALLFKNAWATSHAITDHHVAALASAGRARWKIENEHNHTLKTKGDHFDHHFGHGKQFLANLFATLNLLAYLVHTALDWMDTRYPRCAACCPPAEPSSNTCAPCYSTCRSMTGIISCASCSSASLPTPQTPADFPIQQSLPSPPATMEFEMRTAALSIPPNLSGNDVICRIFSAALS